MMLSVTRQTYDCRVAAEAAYSRKPALMQYIRSQLKLKHVNDAFVRDYAEDVLHSGIELLLSVQYDCANADEAITEAMLRAVQAAAREQSKRQEVPEIVTFSDSKDGSREISRIDTTHNCCESVESIVIDKADQCTLGEAIERAEAVRYIYGFDVLLALFLRAGTEKGMWDEFTANGLLRAFGSAKPSRNYLGDTSIARVVSEANKVSAAELITAMRCNLSRCDTLLSALGYCVA